MLKNLTSAILVYNQNDVLSISYHLNNGKNPVYRMKDPIHGLAFVYISCLNGEPENYNILIIIKNNNNSLYFQRVTHLAEIQANLP